MKKFVQRNAGSQWLLTGAICLGICLWMSSLGVGMAWNDDSADRSEAPSVGGPQSPSDTPEKSAETPKNTSETPQTEASPTEETTEQPASEPMAGSESSESAPQPPSTSEPVAEPNAQPNVQPSPKSTEESPSKPGPEPAASESAQHPTVESGTAPPSEPAVIPPAESSPLPASGAQKPASEPKPDSPAASGPKPTPGSQADPKSKTYLLRYQFHPGETIRWEVTHQATIRTTVSGITQTAESVSVSVKVWKVRDVQPEGTATFEHLVERVQMWQKLTGRQEVRYNSETDKDPPPGFQTIAKSIGVPLAQVTLSPQGKVLRRQRHIVQPQDQNDSPMTLPLPEEPVAIGASWSDLFELDVPLENGAIRKVKTRQRFTLLDVQDGIATIEATTQILTPNLPPEIEAKVIQQDSTGKIRFDLQQGRVLEQQIEVDKRVIGFRGEASSLHCASRFCEKLLDSATHTAQQSSPPASHR